MQLARVRLVGLGPFDDLTVPLETADDAPRPVTLVLGGPGVGKTILLAAIASTRPGYAVVQSQPFSQDASVRGYALADWVLGDDDPSRPHALRVASPNAPADPADEQERVRRREQAFYEKRASEKSGFALVVFPSCRWFSRSPLVLSAPERSVLRYDLRASPTFDDCSRADLARETKQTLCYSEIAFALGSQKTAWDEALQRPQRLFRNALVQVVNQLCALWGYRYMGLDPSSFEPLFESPQTETLPFDRLPTAVRHLVALGALTVRTLHAAYPTQNPLTNQAVVLVDELELHQSASVQQELLPLLHRTLPRVQWIVTSSSPALALGCSNSEVIALRRLPPSSRVELFEGQLATLH